MRTVPLNIPTSLTRLALVLALLPAFASVTHAQVRPTYMCKHGRTLELTVVRGQEFNVSSPGGYFAGRLADLESDKLAHLGADGRGAGFRAVKPGKAGFAFVYYGLRDQAQKKPFKVEVVVHIKPWGEVPRVFGWPSTNAIAVGRGEVFRIRSPLGLENSMIAVEPELGIKLVEVDKTPDGKGIQVATFRAIRPGRRALEWTLRSAPDGKPQKMKTPVLVSGVAGGSRFRARVIQVYAWRDYMPGNDHDAGYLRAFAELHIRNLLREKQTLYIASMDIVTKKGRQRVKIDTRIELAAKDEKKLRIGFPKTESVDLEGEETWLEITIADGRGRKSNFTSWRVRVEKTQ